MPASCVLTFSPIFIKGYRLRFGSDGPLFRPGFQVWRGDQVIQGKVFVGFEHATPAGIRLAYHQCTSPEAAAAVLSSPAGLQSSTGAPSTGPAGSPPSGLGGAGGPIIPIGPGTGRHGPGAPNIPTYTLTGCVGLADPYIAASGLKWRTPLAVLNCGSPTATISLSWTSPTFDICGHGGYCPPGLAAIHGGTHTLPLVSSGSNCIWAIDQTFDFDTCTPPSLPMGPILGQCETGGTGVFYEFWLQELEIYFTYWGSVANPFLEWWVYADGFARLPGVTCGPQLQAFAGTSLVQLPWDNPDDFSVSFTAPVYPHNGPDYVADTSDECYGWAIGPGFPAGPVTVTASA